MSGDLVMFFAGLQQLRDDLVLHGRLAGTALLGEGQIAKKGLLAQTMFLSFEDALIIDDFLGADSRFTAAAWRESERRRAEQHIDSNDSVGVARSLADARHGIGSAIERARTHVNGSRIAAHASLVLETLADRWPATNESIVPSCREASPNLLHPQRTLRGPRKAPLDGAFVPSAAFATEPIPKTVADHAPEFWVMSMREAMAANACALSIIEYDGVPLRMHRDLARQAWDEVRHAELFLELALELLPEFVDQIPRHPLAQSAARFLQSGVGLLVPIEGDHYPAVWMADLVQRLAILQIDGEGSLPDQFRLDLDGVFFSGRPERAQQLSWMIKEEERHGRAGEQWLAYLLPDASSRDAALDDARIWHRIFLAASTAAALGASPYEVLTSRRARPLAG